ncbi:gamma-glutamylcyclotransferase family protein [Pseudoalteromonas sp. S16_S37]|uniref:gamma-glutamylcyclotransferase family protein n=1 Tax=Pseudoalteromonas sp. S16_S37 TaxID=2720228 RepID=UPI00168155DD|nr:gamma-glutamylcyclotransferase family protein [Pseudoalteromonas sp. S16_S37]MBD1580802.1 gamma-glutamylcyclotransferase [Pseudoalteromonas sp. S16_S37]
MSLKPHINFAFGSNMSTKRLFARLPQAQCLGVAKLYGHQLTFNMLSTDGSAKCTIDATHRNDDLVMGVLYALNDNEINQLDIIEGERYDRVTLDVEALEHGPMQAHCYIANTFIDTHLPFDWYVQHVLHGALEHGFPAEYIKHIEAQRHITDHDVERAQREWQLYQKVRLSKKA